MSRPPAAQTRAVLLVMVGFVLVLCLLAYFGLRSLGSGGSGNSGTSGAATGRTTPRPSSSGSPSSGSGPSGSNAATTGGVIKIRSAAGFDPQGDGSEKDNLAKLAYDKKPSSGWTSDTYRSPTWGGLKKGLGLLLDLGRTQTVHSATLSIGGQGAHIQVRAVTSPTSLSGSRILAAKSGAEGTVSLTFAQPAQTQYVVVWFTVPGSFSDGYRAEVDDVKLR